MRFMFCRPLAPILTCAAACLLAGASGLQGGEPIKFSDRERPVDQLRKPDAKPGSRAFDSLNQKDSLGAVMDTPYAPIMQGNNNARKEKQDEMIDRQKNWIFPNPRPEEGDKPVNLNEMFNVRSDPLDPDAKDKKSSKVIERFLNDFEGKNAKRDDSTRSRSFNPTRDAETDPRDPLNYDRDPSYDRSSASLALDALFSEKDKDKDKDKERDKGPGLSSIRNDLFGSDTANRLFQKKTLPGQGSELEKFLSPSPTSLEGKPFGSMDPINLFSDTTRQSLNPVVGMTPEDEPRKPSPFATTTIDLGPRNAGPSALDRFGPRMLGQSLLTPSLPSAVSSERMPQKPIVFELPTRKF